MGHSAYQLYAHITWSTWRRVGCVTGDMAEGIRAAIRTVADRERLRVLRVAVLADHVHLLVSLHPSSRIADFVRVAKGLSAHAVNQSVPGAIKWGRGFHARSVGPRELDVVKRYIARQFVRHPDRVPRLRSAPLTPHQPPASAGG